MVMDEFVKTYLAMIEKPIIENNNIGFLLANGARMYFKDTFISKHNSGRLSTHYKNKGVTNG